MKKIIKRIVDRIRFSYPIMIEESLTKILEEELPDFQRIDWERLRDCFEKASNGYVSSHLHVAVKEYNSTLPPALVPLPKEMPYGFSGLFNETHSAKRVWVWITDHYGTPANNLQPLPGVMPALWHDAFTDLLHNRMQPSEFYSLIRNTYGTPDKPNLPSVEELAKEITVVFNQDSYDMMRSIAQHLHDKYSLHPREWWQDLKEGDKFMWKGQVKTFSYYEIEHKLYIEPFPSMVYCPASDCTPYTSPTADDIIKKHNLSEEEVRVIREGKCT